MSARQRRKARRMALMWMPKMVRALSLSIGFVENNNTEEAVAHLRLCVAILSNAYRVLARRPI